MVICTIDVQHTILYHKLKLSIIFTLDHSCVINTKSKRCIPFVGAKSRSRFRTLLFFFRLWKLLYAEMGGFVESLETVFTIRSIFMLLNNKIHLNAWIAFHLIPFIIIHTRRMLTVYALLIDQIGFIWFFWLLFVATLCGWWTRKYKKNK